MTAQRARLGARLPGLLLAAALRAGLVLFAGGSALLALEVLPHARDVYRDSILAGRLVNGQGLKPEVVSAALAEIERRNAGRTCADEPELPRLVFSTWLAEEALVAGRIDELAALQARALHHARTALACEPLNGFAAAMMARFRFLAEGHDPAILPLLRLSHAQAPREAWVIERRAPVAAAMIDVLEPADRERLTRDLVAMVEAGLIREAVDIVQRLPAATQSEISRAVGKLEPAYQSAYQRRATQIGVAVTGLTVPPRLDVFR